MSGDQQASGRNSAPSPWRDGAGCLVLALAMLVMFVVSDSIQRWPYRIVPYLVVAGGVALVEVHLAHRRGQTVAEAIAARRAERRRLSEVRAHAREAATALPWLRDKRLRPDTVPGVLIAPEPPLPGYHHAGYDVVVESAGDVELGVVRQVMRLTRVHPKIAKDLIDGAPVTVLRVPDLAMADAAKTILESAGATVSINGPAN